MDDGIRLFNAKSDEKLDEAVAAAKVHKEWRREYMTLERMMMDSRREGKEIHFIEQIQKKVATGKELTQIAKEIQEGEEDIRDLFEAVCAAPEKTAEEILNIISRNAKNQATEKDEVSERKTDL